MGYIPRVKSCCIGSVEEMRMAVRYGAHALGLVARMPSGPGVIAEATIREIARTIPPGVASFLLTSERNAGAITEQQRRCGTNTIQLTDRLASSDHAQLREALPGIGLVQVIHVADERALLEATGVAPFVDALLLDSGNPELEVKELGGTGRVHNWEISQRICEAVDVPVYLAGGLTPENVREAIRTVHPFGVDVCSGLRTDGHLDEAKLASYMRAVWAASALC